MDDEDKIKKATEIQLNSLRREKLIKGAIEEYKNENNNSIEVSITNSSVKIDGDFTFVYLRDNNYNLLQSYRVFDDVIFKKIND